MNAYYRSRVLPEARVLILCRRNTLCRKVTKTVSFLRCGVAALNMGFRVRVPRSSNELNVNTPQL
jgi:hypothetical protein